MIGIDAPDFTLGVEHKLRQAGLRTVHYVSPSVWAWRQKRVLKIRETCDLMLAFPLRSTFLRRAWGACAFRRPPLGQPPFCRRIALRPRAARIAGGRTGAGAMPGEIVAARSGKLGALFLDTAQHLLVERPGLRFVLPCASAARREQIEQMLQGREPLPLTLLDGASHEALPPAMRC